jgi:hypothetical protein
MKIITNSDEHDQFINTLILAAQKHAEKITEHTQIVQKQKFIRSNAALFSTAQCHS